MSAQLQTMHGMEELGEREFMLLSRLIYERSGIHLGEQKQTLLKARLGKRLRALGLTSFEQYYHYLTQCDSNGGEMVHMLDAISTNLTEFFREPAHFDYLKQTFFPRWRSAPQLRILSAGCSTGEEPYSIAICAREYFGAEALLKTRIVAGDICTRVVARARTGIYEAERVAAIASDRLRASFLRGTGDNKGLVMVAPEIKATVEFIHLNIVDNPQLDGDFHAIFCRNVAIYFDKATRTRVFERFRQILVPGGTLFVGHAESLAAFSREYEYIQPSVYERPVGSSRP